MKKFTTKIVMGLLCPKRPCLNPKITFFLILIFLCLATRINAQIINSVKIAGTVIGDKDNGPLFRATVAVGNVKTTTDQFGHFEVLTKDTSGIINVSFLGYQNAKQSFGLKNIGPFQIRLSSFQTQLQEVVVSTGYQNVPKERATGSFVQVDSALVNRRVSTDIISRLEGVVPGLLFNRNTPTSANGGVDISIRGHSTLFSNDQPLIVLDNFPYDGDVNNINPNDIASITVLKDAAASSIWGVRSGNGVIVITSKRGKQGQKLAVEFNANLTVGTKPNLFYSPNFLDSKDYIGIEKSLFNSGYYNNVIGDPSSAISPVVQLLSDQASGLISSADANNKINALQNADYRNELNKYLYQKSALQQYEVNFRGGGVKSDYFLSLGEDHNTLNAIGNSDNRITLNSNYNFYPVKNLQISAGLYYVQGQTSNNSPTANLTYGSGVIYPYTILEANGIPQNITHNLNYQYASTATQQGLLDWTYNPLNELHYADNTTNSVDNRINVGASYQFIPGLSASVKYLYERQSSLLNDYYSTDTYYTRNLINQYTIINPDGSLTYPIPVGGILEQEDSYLTSQHLRAQLNFNKTIALKNEVNVIAGSEITDDVNEGNTNTAYGYDKSTESNYSQIDYADFYNLNPSGQSSAKIPNNQGFIKTTDHYISYFGNASYSYDSKYTLSVSGRIDKSNLFGVATNQKAVPLYSVGTSWNIAREQFYNFSWLPTLKLRATYGINGNVNKTATAVTTFQLQSNSPYSGIPYNIIASPGNPDLRWEKDRMANFAIDFGSYNNIITGSFDYFVKKSTDLFGNAPLPPSTGITSFYGNTASTKGHGFDLVLNSKNITIRDFKWRSTFMISRAFDEVLRYDVPATVSTYLSTDASLITPLAGKPVYSIYSFQSGPLTHQTGDPQGYLNGKLSTDYASIIANTQISNLIFVGSSRPLTYGSFSNTFNYKNWSLSANFIFKFDYYFRRSSTGLSDVDIISGGVNRDYSERWQVPGDESHTTVPSITLTNTDANRRYFYEYSQALVDKGDNIRLQDIRLSYDMATRKSKRLPFSQFQIFTYINNVGIIWRANHDGLDPDVYSTGLPLPLTVSIGIHTNL